MNGLYGQGWEGYGGHVNGRRPDARRTALRLLELAVMADAEYAAEYRDSPVLD